MIGALAALSRVTEVLGPDAADAPAGIRIHVEIAPLQCLQACFPELPGVGHGAQLPEWLQVMLTALGVAVVLAQAWGHWRRR